LLSPADSKAVADIRWREPLCWWCGSAKKWISCVKRWWLRLESSMSRTRPILRSLVGGARLFGVWWRQEFDQSASWLPHQLSKGFPTSQLHDITNVFAIGVWNYQSQTSNSALVYGRSGSLPNDYLRTKRLTQVTMLPSLEWKRKHAIYPLNHSAFTRLRYIMAGEMNRI
jgi:hypothetical protein